MKRGLTLVAGIGFVLATAVSQAHGEPTSQDVGKVATTACGGTWAITPDALKGKERVRLVGGQSGQQTSARR
jgi:hypothetical protein